MNKLAVLLVLIGLLTGLASANSIASEEIKIDLEESVVEVEVDVKELTQNRFNYYVQSYQVDRVISGQIDGEDANCFLRDEQSLDSQVSCETDKEGNFTANLVLEGTGWVNHLNSASRFQYTQNMHNPTDNYSLTVILPPGATIVDQENSTEPVIHPANGDVQTTGQRIFVEWNEEPELGELLNFHVLYQTDAADNFPWSILLLAIVVGIGGVAFFYFYQKMSSDSNLKKLKEELDEDEIYVLDKLLENDGEALQKDIVNESDYSKAKVSGLVSGLVEDDIITKEKEGRSNKLVLEEEYR